MSTETLSTTQPSDSSVQLEPSFWGALRGVWLFTWKSQMTLKRLGIISLSFLGLPLLIYLTTSSPAEWARENRFTMGRSATFLNGFVRRVSRAQMPLNAQQQSELSRILNEEYQKAESKWVDDVATEPSAEKKLTLAEDCDEQILQRAEKILDERQFAEFQSYQKRHANQRTVQQGEGWSRTRPFFHCLIDLYFFILLPLNCIRMCGALIRDELEADTLTFLTTRPVSRARLLIVKFISQTILLQILLLIHTLCIFGAGAFRGIPDLGKLLWIFLGVQFLAVLAWSALGVFLGQISKKYMALALVYGAIVEMGIGRIPTNINSLSLMRHLKTMLSHNSTLQSIFHWPTATVGRPVEALIIGTALFLIVAAILFTYREYHHTSEMQK